MPRIPLPQEQPSGNEFGHFRTPDLPANGVVARPDYSGVQLARFGTALNETGEAVGAVASHLQDQLDDARVNEAEALASDAFRQGVDQYRAKIGKEAVDARDKVVSDLDAKKKEAADILTNDLQRRIYGQRIEAHRQAAMAAIDSHYIQQAHIYDVGQRKAGLESTVGNAVAFPDDPLYLPLAIRKAEDLADAQFGKGADVEKDNLVTEATTKIHTDRIRSLVETDHAAQAAAYLNSVLQEPQGQGPEGPKRPQIDPTAVPALQRLVKTATTNEEALQVAADVTQQVDDMASNRAQSKEDILAGKEPTPLKVVTPQFLDDARNLLEVRRKAGTLSADAYERAWEQLKQNYSIRVQQDMYESKVIKDKAEQWMQTQLMSSNPLAPALMPAELRQGLEQHNELGSVTFMQARVNRSRAIALSGLIREATMEARPLAARADELKRSIGNPQTEPAKRQKDQAQLDQINTQLVPLTNRLKVWVPAQRALKEGLVGTGLDLPPEPKDMYDEFMDQYQIR